MNPKLLKELVATLDAMRSAFDATDADGNYLVGNDVHERLETHYFRFEALAHEEIANNG